jgi:CubicO group peptidase (beta-lactamase class C family)
LRSLRQTIESAAQLTFLLRSVVRVLADREESVRCVCVAALIAFVMLCLPRPAGAQIPPAKPKSAAPTANVSVPPRGDASHELTHSDVEEFFDLLIKDQLAREDIAGAIVGVVKDGQVVIAKGYGYADVEKRVPATGDASLFRIGSISKLITWTAAMQLVEQKKLSLDEDVNTYLDFKIPTGFGKPITLRNLMTHTAGFEDTWRDLGVAEPQQLIPLETYVKTHMPKRIYPPGEVSAYSNYGATLAGYLVQRVSGETFEAYTSENIFHPLAMNRTTFAQPPSADLASLVSKGYGLASRWKCLGLGERYVPVHDRALAGRSTRRDANTQPGDGAVDAFARLQLRRARE